PVAPGPMPPDPPRAGHRWRPEEDQAAEQVLASRSRDRAYLTRLHNLGQAVILYPVRFKANNVVPQADDEGGLEEEERRIIAHYDLLHLADVLRALSRIESTV